MERKILTENLSKDRRSKEKMIFSNIFVYSNMLQKIFNREIPILTLKQFMLVALIRQINKPLTYTCAGKILGSSRQNIRRIAESLEKEGFLTIEPMKEDKRAQNVFITPRAERYFIEEFKDYERDLKYLFEVFDDEELGQFFNLMNKLSLGIESLDRRGH